MAYVIAEPCIGVKDAACVDACPVDCIHPKKDSEKFANEELIYIDPVECIDCGRAYRCARFPPSLLLTIFPRSGPSSLNGTPLTSIASADEFKAYGLYVAL